MGRHQESEEEFRVHGMEVGKRGKERNDSYGGSLECQCPQDPGRCI